MADFHNGGNGGAVAPEGPDRSSERAQHPDAHLAHIAGPTFAGHPVGLFVLFLTEMWERFTFYGMRALLVLFMTNVMRKADGEANLIYGAYQALVYALPLFGGIIADKLLGHRRVIYFGGITMAIGSLLLAAPAEWTFYLGMGFVACGNCYFKPNISTIVGDLYAEGDRRTDENDSSRLERGGKLGILGKEAVAGMDCVDFIALANIDDGVDVQVRPNGLARFADLIRFVRLEAVQCKAIFVGVDGNRANSQFVGTAENSRRNFAAIGSEQFSDRFHVVRVSPMGNG